MSGELRLLFKQLGEEKWRELGDDGNSFDRSSDGCAEAWREAQAAANLGIPWAGATYRLVDPCEGDHADDCALGLDSTAWCDCGIEPTVVEERVVMPEGPPVFQVRTRVLGPGEADALGLGGLVVEGTIEPGEE